MKQQDNATGCIGAAATWTYTVYDLPPVKILSAATYFCENSSVELTASGANSYTWSTGDVSESIDVSTADTYSVTGTDPHGCRNSSRVEISETPLPQVVANNDTIVCYGSKVALGTQQHIGTLSWDSPLTVDVTGPQTCTVTASNACGSASDSMAVDIFAPILFTTPDPLPPYRYKKYYEHELSFENAEPPVYLRWLGSLPTGMMITPTGMMTTPTCTLRGTPFVTGYNFNSHRFSLIVEDGHGCVASQAFSLTPLFAQPTAIIRDGSENEHFLPDFEVEIFNRQGILLHKGKGWRGTSGYVQVPPGTYFYKVSIMQDGELRQHIGYVTVLQ